MMMEGSGFEAHTKALGKLLKDSIITDRKMDLIAYRDIGYSGSSTALVVRSRSYEDISRLLAYCNEHSIGVTPWGGGTNLCGALTPDRQSIAMDLKSLNDILEINTEDALVTVQAGATIEAVETRLNRHRLTFCHDPWSRRSSTVGGALALDSVGNFYPKFGSIGDQVLSMKVALADGRIITLGRNITKSSASPFLPSLFIGSEGRFGIILEATLMIQPLPETHTVMGYAFSSFADLFEAIKALKRSDIEPQSYIGGTVPKRVEKLQPKTERVMVKLLNIHAALFLYYDGIQGEVDARSAKANEILSSSGRKMPDKYAEEWWANRHTYFEMSPELADEGIYVHVFDLCVPGSKIAKLSEDIQDLAGELNIEDRLSHTIFGAVDAYTVALYVEDDDAGRELVKEVERAIIPLVHNAGGTITRTHGLGTLFGDDVAEVEIGKDGIDLMAGIKSLLDPNDIMNPGVLCRRL